MDIPTKIVVGQNCADAVVTNEMRQTCVARSVNLLIVVIESIDLCYPDTKKFPGTIFGESSEGGMQKCLISFHPSRNLSLTVPLGWVTSSPTPMSPNSPSMTRTGYWCPNPCSRQLLQKVVSTRWEPCRLYCSSSAFRPTSKWNEARHESRRSSLKSCTSRRSIPSLRGSRIVSTRARFKINLRVQSIVRMCIWSPAPWLVLMRL